MTKKISFISMHRGPNKFKTIVRYGSGYEKFECLSCHNEIVIPANKINRTIWCSVCDNTRARPKRCKKCGRGE